jgi:hypothetical protein
MCGRKSVPTVHQLFELTLTAIMFRMERHGTNRRSGVCGVGRQLREPKLQIHSRKRGAELKRGSSQRPGSTAFIAVIVS